MRPLIQISTTPAQYEYAVTRARLEMSQKQPTVDRTTKRATVNMQRQAGKLEMNTTRRRSDMGMKGVVDRAQTEADRGLQQALQTTASYAEFGNQVAQFHKGATIPDALWNRTMQQMGQGDLMLVPLSPIEMQYTPASVSMEATPGQMQAEWNVGAARLDFVPGTFSLNMTQYASINFEYVGGFIYAPPSADPNFEAKA